MIREWRRHRAIRLDGGGDQALILVAQRRGLGLEVLGGVGTRWAVGEATLHIAPVLQHGDGEALVGQWVSFRSSEAVEETVRRRW